ncbi:MAG: CTP synthase [Nanoarchaeota archaeon]|nr:CTP synthase [Nanoarchaeota archaeon]MBU1004986.1 CTP synthase [Nanoarchaeota archaeon]MBU1946247.1 CTP synthase [Nanoarchaeota archaeon]
MVKFIVVVGGVISGVGKGVTTSSIGKILQEYGYNVTAVKIDPYINYDAGTLRPTEHGEVWVTDDGGEIDQDLGNYERFLGIDIPKINNLTTGQIYKTVIDNERAGKYLGQTVQFIPHIPDEIKKRINDASKGYDFCLIEIGGTIGDYENIPFLFAMKSMEREIGKENVVYVMITYLPVPSHIEEMKTKPTQQAIRLLTEHGIIPDFIICRAKKELDDVRKKKIEIYANIKSDHVISEPDIDTIYRIPLDLEKENMGLKILEEFKMKPKSKPDWKEWSRLVENIVDHGKVLKIAIVGKYVDIGDYSLADSYISINQALQHAAASLNAKVEIVWVDSKSFEKDEKKLNELKNYNGLIIPGGFGGSGVEGKIKAIKFARENNLPFLGLCYGMQLAVVEFARNVCGMMDANTTEVNPKTKYPVIDILPAQKKLMEESKYGGTMRLGAYAALLKEDSRVFELYKETGRLDEDTKRIAKLKENKDESFRLGNLDKGKIVLERHRHRFEVNPEFIADIEKKGLVFSGYHVRGDEAKLMEFIELPKHKFFVGTQAHPEFKSSLTNPSPLFYGFVKACVK